MRCGLSSKFSSFSQSSILFMHYVIHIVVILVSLFQESDFVLFEELAFAFDCLLLMC